MSEVCNDVQMEAKNTILGALFSNGSTFKNLGSKWLLWSLYNCYDVYMYVLLFLANITLRGSYRIVLSEGVTVA